MNRKLQYTILAADLLWGRWAQGAVTGLVVDLLLRDTP